MVADRQKYPTRRLGRFLWLRDLSHHVRYMIEQNKGQVPVDALPLAEEAVKMFEGLFGEQNDAFLADALSYVAPCYGVLGRGMEVEVSVKIRKPEMTGDDTIGTQFAGRIGTRDQLEKLLHGVISMADKWEGPYA
jgi:hypothetical protein